ncbi:DUF2185 domain-containing protein [Aquincola sp. J276]|uniref:DUF2185 domain-containing protein n=1 Tax=Aquincola sp. J276 TaxID=2898432 RepID=UPI002150F8CC|nr:DUF2185 domain-containing protein [Aquincola sp. J276]MCR5867738.1 DUF2185 domain-containing protein [Aquincola sp. J276]
MSSPTCVATEVITTRQKSVGYAYRDKPVSPADSGWRFLSGSESEQYMDQPSHYVTCVLADFVREHPEVAPLLAHPVGSAFARTKAGGSFEAVPE